MRSFDLGHYALTVVSLMLLLYILKPTHEPAKLANFNHEPYSVKLEERKEMDEDADSSEEDSFLKQHVYYNKETPLVWIGGVPRSGTTLTRALIDAHPDVRCGEETRIIPKILGIHSWTTFSLVEMTRLAEVHIDEKLLNYAVGSYTLAIIAGHGEPAPLLCNKDPLAILAMDTITAMLPNSKFILMIRDGRAVSHSIISRQVIIEGFDMINYDGSLKNWSTTFTPMITVCAKYGPEICLPVYYERLVLNPKEQMERITRFLGIPWNDIVLHHEDAIGVKGGISLSEKEPSTNQVIRPINKDGLARWVDAIPRSVLDNIDTYAPMLRQLGYNTSVLTPDYSKHLNPIAEHDLSSFEYLYLQYEE